jgi:hypothetical protein
MPCNNCKNLVYEQNKPICRALEKMSIGENSFGHLECKRFVVEDVVK